MPVRSIKMKTACYDMHCAAGGKMVEFAGYQMPVQYTDGIMAEHLHTRTQAGLFDVSHMGQVLVSGANSAAELESIIPVDIATLAINQQSYAVFTNENGGILDDLIVTRLSEDTFFLVVNAACKEQDIAHLTKHLSSCEVSYQSDKALLALQGPAACSVLARFAPVVESLVFMNGVSVSIGNVECFITRSGYTGEDGFEISMPVADAEKIANILLDDDAVKWIGLGARDSLRLESGLCLYGHDMNEETTVIEAGLAWSVSRSRRLDAAKEGGFPGADIILEQLKNGAPKKRVGLSVDGRAPVREGTVIVNEDGAEIGIVTSGGFSPSLEKPIAMAYVDASYAAADTKVQALVRGKLRPMTVSKLPFVKQNYVRG
jgi:aminomethyltransferase